MQRICQIVGWLLLSVLLFSGGLMSILILTENPFWSAHPLRQHLLPIGHAHAGILGVVMLLYGLYLDKVNLPARVRNLAAGIYIVGALTLPGGFLVGALQDSATKPGIGFISVPIGGILVGISFIMMFIGMLRTPKAGLTSGNDLRVD